MRYLDRGGVRLAWNDAGSGPPILLIMGHRYSSRMWYPVVEGLGGRFRLISFDNRGTGESGSRARTSVAEMTADALAVLDAAGIDRAHIYGVSMGGGIAIEFAVRYPERVRSLILGCTVAFTAEKPRARALAREILYRLPMWLLKRLGKRDHKDGYGDAADDAAIARDREVIAGDRFSRQGVLAQARAIAAYAVSRQAVQNLTMPALVLHGTQDAAVPYAYGQELAAWLPNGRFVTLEDCGHNYFVAAGERANAEVEDFIRGVEAGTRPK